MRKRQGRKGGKTQREHLRGEEGKEQGKRRKGLGKRRRREVRERGGPITGQLCPRAEWGRGTITVPIDI